MTALKKTIGFDPTSEESVSTLMTIQQPMHRTITLESLQKEIFLLKNDPESSLEKFSYIRRSSNMEVVNWMYDNNINTWSSLIDKEPVMNTKESGANFDRLIDIVLRRKIVGESIEEMVVDILTDLKPFELKKATQSRIIAHLVAPTNTEKRRTFLTCTEPETLIELARIEDEEWKKLPKCNKCGRKGHNESKCFAKSA